PYVTPAMFRAYPTWLDLDNLIPGGVEGVQDDELADVLLAASDWAVGDVLEGMALHAHWVQGENRRTRTGAGGRVYIKPYDVPVRAVTALAWGVDPTLMNAGTLPDPSMWIEDGREVSFLPGGATASFTGPAIQFGPRLRQDVQTYVNWSYVAGYPSTFLPSGCAADASTVTVADPAGILPGDTLRIYDPGLSEALTVAATYSPAMPTVPPTPTAVPLAGATAYTHAALTGVTGMPRRALQSVIAYGVALLMREDVSAEEPVGAFGPAARTAGSSQRGGQAAGLVNDAARWLSSFKPTLRS
ncbi:MAG: hypothetical protein ACRDND_32570, partial [Streptosporangiaceae bacterium]